MSTFKLQLNVPEINLWWHISSSARKRRESLENQAIELYNNALSQYHSEKETQYKCYITEKEKFLNNQKEFNQSILQWKDGFEAGEPEFIEKYIVHILKFKSVYTKSVDSVVFNRIVNGIEKSTGLDFTSCIISLQASRITFESLNLKRVDVKACFRQLKGLTAEPLAQLAPVKPIMYLNKNDKRFVKSKDVLDNMDPGFNLAAMPWEDFEQLVRELFGKMFNSDGCDVKVTQASRDGGVDAVVLYPDPIKGGKCVIQAKRYTNVVPVSSVRDLYGTLINEGAVKGILVTTSRYGSDSREFVKDNPISLIDGANLVYLLNKYGYSAHVSIKAKGKKLG